MLSMICDYLVVVLKKLCISIKFASDCEIAMQMVELLKTAFIDICEGGTQAFKRGFFFCSNLRKLLLKIVKICAIPHTLHRQKMCRTFTKLLSV